MTSPLQAVLFDFDGTLATYRSHLELYVSAAAGCGIAVTEERLREFLVDAWRPWLTPEGIDHSAHSTAEATYNAEVRSRLHVARLAHAGATGDLDTVAARICELEGDPVHFEVYEDTLPVLERLKAEGLRTAIVSNHIWRLPEVVDGLGLGPYIDHVLTSARVGYRKPHPAIYQAALKAVGVPADAALFVGDSPSHDIDGPRAAGMRAVLIDRSGRNGHLDAIHTLDDLVLS
jgi:putative hydrolase of the HAD superfamily